MEAWRIWDNKVKPQLSLGRLEYLAVEIVEMLGSLQDTVKQEPSPEENTVHFEDYTTYIANVRKLKLKENSSREKKIYQRTYFYNYLFPTFFAHVEASILEYQQKEAVLTEV